MGKIRYRGESPDKSFSDSSRLTFRGSEYHDRSAAETAGRALKELVQLASIDARVPIDVGAEHIRTQPGQVMIDFFADQGIQLLPDVHGLLIFEETGVRPAPLSMNAAATVSTPLKYFLNSLVIRSRITKSVGAKQSLACQVYSLSNFEASLRSRLLSLVTVLDVLSNKVSREGISLTVATEILDIVKARLREARKSNYAQQELRQLESLVSIVGSLRYVSISTSIKMLAQDIGQEVLNSMLTPGK